MKLNKTYDPHASVTTQTPRVSAGRSSRSQSTYGGLVQRKAKSAIDDDSIDQRSDVLETRATVNASSDPPTVSQEDYLDAALRGTDVLADASIDQRGEMIETRATVSAASSTASAASSTASAGPLSRRQLRSARRTNPHYAKSLGWTAELFGASGGVDSDACAQAIATFQAEAGLPVDGIAGPNTVRARRAATGQAADGQRVPDSAVQRRASDGAAQSDGQVHDAARQGVQGAATTLPHLDSIQASFGRHDVSGVAAHVGGDARMASDSIGADAYALGNHVAFGGQPNLHTAAHEAAHVVQQRGGVQLSGGVGQSGDIYEQHADRVADAVVAGGQAESILDEMAGGRGRASDAVQKNDATPDSESFRVPLDGEHVMLSPTFVEFSKAGETQKIHAMHLPGDAPHSIFKLGALPRGRAFDLSLDQSSGTQIREGHMPVILARFIPLETGTFDETVTIPIEPKGPRPFTLRLRGRHGVDVAEKDDARDSSSAPDRMTDSMVGQIEVSPNWMRFLGTTEVGLSSTDRICSLTNVSDQPVELDRVAQLDQPVHFDAVLDVATPKTLEPRETVRLNVSFQPKEPGAHDTTLHVLLTDGTAAGTLKIEGKAVAKSRKTIRKEEEEEIIRNAIPVELEDWPIEKIGRYISDQAQAALINLAGAFDVWQAYLDAPSTDEAKEESVASLAAEAAKDQVFKAILRPLDGVPGGGFVKSLFEIAWGTAKAQAKDRARAGADKEAIKVRDFVATLGQEITEQTSTLISQRENFLDELHSNHDTMTEGPQIEYRMRLRDAGHEMKQALAGPASVSGGFTAISAEWIHKTEVRSDESYFELVLDHDWTLTKAFLHAPRGDRLAEGLMAQHCGKLNLAAMEQVKVKIKWYPFEGEGAHVTATVFGDGTVLWILPRSFADKQLGERYKQRFIEKAQTRGIPNITELDGTEAA